MNFYSILCITLVTVLNLPFNNGYNILALFPHPGISHFYFFQPVLKELARRGHNVTVVSNFPEKNPIGNYTDLQISDANIMKEDIDLNIFEQVGKPPLLPTIYTIYGWGITSCENTLKSDAIKKILDPNSKFDVVLVEQFNSDCMLSLGYLKKAPMIGLSSSGILPWHYSRTGTPFITSYMPNIFLGVSEDMNFMVRLQNWFYHHISNFVYKYFIQTSTNRVINKYLNNSVPDVEELTKQIKLMLVNQHFSLSGVKPWSSSVIEVSGLQIEKPKPLSGKIKQILDRSEKGVIYISWGSLIRSDTLSSEKRDAILKALSRLEQTVLWKWENEDIPNRPKNVHVLKWMPQQDILSHPNVKVFMNHGGLLGTTEAVYNGVPMVTTPILGDQFLNAAAIEHRKIGVILPLKDITEENVLNALKLVLKPEYQERAKFVAEAYKNRPDSALNTAIWWIEHFIRMKGTILAESIAIELPWYIYYSLDVYCAIILILVVIYYCLKIFIKLVRYIKSLRMKKEKKN